MSHHHSSLCRYFKKPSNLEKLRNLISTYIWTHMDFGYSQGMCDILAPLLVTLDDEPLVYACYLRLMETAQELFPPSQGMNTKLANVQALLQVSPVVVVATPPLVIDALLTSCQGAGAGFLPVSKRQANG